MPRTILNCCPKLKSPDYPGICFTEQLRDVAVRSLQNMTSRFLMQSSMFANILIYGHYDTATQQATLIVLTTHQLLGSLGASPFLSLGTIVNKRESNEVGPAIHAGWCQAVILGIICSSIAYFIEPILKLAQQPGTITSTVGNTFKPYVFSLSYMTYAQFWADANVLLSHRQEGIFLFIMLISAITGTLANLFLTSPQFANLGLQGLGYAHGIQNGISLGLSRSYILLSHKYRNQFKIRQLKLGDTCKLLYSCNGIFFKGLWAFVDRSSDIVAICCIAVMAGWLNPSATLLEGALETYRLILSRLAPKAICFVLKADISKYSGYLASIAQGKTNELPDAPTSLKRNAKNRLLAAIICFSLLASIIIIILLTLPRQLANLVVSPPANQQPEFTIPLIPAFRMIALGTLLEGSKLVTNAVAGGFNYFLLPAFASLIGNIAVAVPLAYLFGYSQKLGVVGLELGANIGFAFTLLTLLGLNLVIYLRQPKIYHSQPLSEQFNQAINDDGASPSCFQQLRFYLFGNSQIRQPLLRPTTTLPATTHNTRL